MWFSKKTNIEYVIQPKITLPSDFLIIDDLNDITRDLKIVNTPTQEMETIKVQNIKKKRIIRNVTLFIQQIVYFSIMCIAAINVLVFLPVVSLKIVMSLILFILWINCASTLAKIQLTNEIIHTASLKVVQKIKIREVLKYDTTTVIRAIRKNT